MRTVRNLPLIFRTFEVSLEEGVRALREEGRDLRELIGKGALYDVSFSSEEPANQWYWELGLIKETLSHSRSAVLLDRLKKTGAVLWNHDRFDQIGRIRDPRVDSDSKRLTGKLQFSRTQRGQDFELDAVDDIKVSVSVGYRAIEMKLVRRGDVEKGEIDEYLITKWEPHEMSVVSIPADVNVGIDRSEAEELVRRSGGATFPVEIEDGHAVEEVGTMKTKAELAAEAAAAAAVANGDDAAVAVADPPVTPTRSAAPAAGPDISLVRSDRDKEVAEIIQMCRQSGVETEAGGYIARGLNPQQAAYEIQKLRATVAVVQPGAEFAPKIAAKELEKYSIRKAILMTIPKSEGGMDWGGLEAEAHAEMEKQIPKEARRPEGIRGILVPSNIPCGDPRKAARAARDLGRPGADRLLRLLEDLAERAYPLDSVTATEGTEFKFTSAMPFIEQLRNRLITARLGARFYTNLPGPVGFPRQTAGATAAWQSAEAAAVADSMAAFELMTMTPKTLIATTGTTRQLLRMASEDFEALLRDDILKQHRVAIDTAAFVGTGASGQPSGLYVLSGIQSYDIGAGAGANGVPDYVDITSMIGLLGDANADDGAVAFAMTPLLAATLMRTLTFPAANTGTAIWQGTKPSEGLCAMYRALASNVLSKTLNNGVPTGGTEHGIVLGNYNELFIGEWGAFEIVADPYSSKKSGIVELTSFQMVDVNVRHQASFVKGINAIP